MSVLPLLAPRSPHPHVPSPQATAHRTAHCVALCDCDLTLLTAHDLMGDMNNFQDSAKVVRERAVKRLSELQAAGTAQIKATDEGEAPRQRYLKKLSSRNDASELSLFRFLAKTECVWCYGSILTMTGPCQRCCCYVVSIKNHADIIVATLLQLKTRSSHQGKCIGQKARKRTGMRGRKTTKATARSSRVVISSALESVLV